MKVNANVIGAAIGAVAGGTAGYFVGRVVEAKKNDSVECSEDARIEVSPNCAALDELDASEDTNAVTE
jgi:membrane protein YqaA with SNARE-associated domain